MASNQLPNFYSRFSLYGTQPYKTSYEYMCKGTQVPGMTWIPDYSMWNVNKPNFPSGPLVESTPKMSTQGRCQLCQKYVGATCGYEFWNTRKLYNYPK